MAARKHAAVAELIRRRPARGGGAPGGAGLAEAWDEFTAAELAPALGCSRGQAEVLLWLAHELEACLPGTKAAFRAGVIGQHKAAIIAAATALLDPAEARAAEALVRGRAGSLTPAGLRAAIARVVLQVAPGKAGKRREHAARLARVERWAEDSGNAGLAGRELPPAQVLAADQRVTWWAEQLKRAGLDGGMDVLRARAYLDILLGTDSRPTASTPGGPSAASNQAPVGQTAGSTPDDTPADGKAPNGGGPDEPAVTDEPPVPAPTGPLDGVVPPGFAGKVTLTIPLATLLNLPGLADRPGELAGIGPIDPGLARDLAAAAARSPRSTWCLTVTDEHGHAIGHGCARPQPASSHRDRAQRDPPRVPGGPGPPPFTFTPADQHGPPGGYGTWRLAAGTGGRA